MEFLSLTVFLGNSLLRWLVALVLFCLVYFGLYWLGRALLRRISQVVRLKKETSIDELTDALAAKINRTFVILIALDAASRPLSILDSITKILDVLAFIGLILQLVLWGLAVIDYLVKRQIEADPRNAATSATTMSAVSLVAKIVIWSLAILLILQNATGLDMNGLLAALGIGGIAIALAVQTILSDLFASVSIVLDKPFVIGDLISVDQLSGNVEYIGLKSTRLRSVTGEQLVFSNSDLLARPIRNFQRLERRRVIFMISVDYNTPAEKLAALPSFFQQAVEAQQLTTFERAHFKEFSSQALNFEIVYVVESPETQVILDAQQAVNLAISQRLAEEGIQLALPSQAAPKK